MSISTVSISGVFSSSELSQTLKSFEISLVKAQTLSELYGCTVALRVERSFETNSDGTMTKDTNGQVQWLNYQQIRFVVQGFKQNNSFGGYLDSVTTFNGFVPEQYGFRHLGGEKVLELPKSAWLAPGPSLNNLNNWNIQWQPTNNNAVPINLFETFYIAFDHSGTLTYNANWLYYIDETQPYQEEGTTRYPAVDYPYNVVRSAIAYDRVKFNNASNKTQELSNGTWLPLTRHGRIP